ncbi:hypothetical protein Q9233_015672 [Columba guinea]|nr:hypothetical protein Q9233_015672 [Columba guinea]
MRAKMKVCAPFAVVLALTLSSDCARMCLQKMEIYANFLSGMVEGFITRVYQIYFPERNGAQQHITLTGTGDGDIALPCLKTTQSAGYDQMPLDVCFPLSNEGETRFPPSPGREFSVRSLIAKLIAVYQST